MIYEKIEQLLVAQVQTVTNLPEWQKENVRYTTKNGQPFIRSTLLPAQPQIISLGVNGTTKHQGLFQIDCFSGQDIGSGVSVALADRIITAFNKGTTLEIDGVQVLIELSYRQSAYQMASFYGVPVIVQWSCYHV